MSDLQKKPHSVRITVTSISEGVENQLITVDEGASTPEELTRKCFTVTDAINGAMEALAQEGGYPIGIPSGKGKK